MRSKNIFKPIKDKIICKSGFCILITVSLFLCIVISATGSEDRVSINIDGPSKRTDIISIDKMKIFGELQEPVVDFYHDLHTDSLVKTPKDCQQCHQTVKNRLSTEFMQSGDKSKQEVVDIYHNNCIVCHEETKGKKGPVTCRECHTKKPKNISDVKRLDFDKSLHFRHTEALENKCAACHHEYDKKTDKLVYIKDKESSCSYCHKETNEDNRISIRNASHNSCIPCHLSMKEKKQTTGPVECGGCHDLKKQKLIEKEINPPRLKRKQPDHVLIKTGNPKVDDVSKNRMNFVPFNHKAHEKANDNCKTCHHKSLASCNSCHAIEGTKEGGGVSLEKAMHDPNSAQSCLGCHNIKKQDKDCLGCHALIHASKATDENTCYVCHKRGIDFIEEDLSKLLEPIDNSHTADFPEKVIIKKLEDQYKPVEFPHGKIIAALEKKVNESQLASSFHNKKGLMCSGCHHNLPITKKPSACSTCHDASIKKKSTGKPGLMAAYHIQCMECHENMNIGKTGCTDCHEKK